MKCVNPSLGKLVQETVVFECQLVKYNHVNKRQERLLVVSEKFIYNILPNETFFSRFSSSYRLRRKIGLEKVTGVTMSQSGFEFVIHIPGEHDYRYSSSEHKEQAVSSLCQAYCRLTGKKGLSVFLKPELTLEKYTTTKTDAKKAVSRMPTEGGVQLDSLEGLKAGDKDSVVFSRDGRKMSLQSFQMMSVISKGSYGKVMICERIEDKRLYVLKSFRKEQIVSNQLFQNIRTERKVLEIVEHPFLVNLEYALQSKDKVFYFTVFVEGGDLFSYLRRRKVLSEEEARFIAAQVVLAIDYLHSLGIVHRDLKPENMLIGADGYLKLTDFGVSKFMSRDDYDQSFVGTKTYMAPEIIEAQKHTFRVDFWSLGVVIFEMLNGVPPFFADKHKEMLRSIFSEPVSFVNEHVSPDAVSFCLHLLQKDPRVRLSSLQGVKDHPWMRGFNWEALQSRTSVSPLEVQVVKVSKMRLSNEYANEVLNSLGGQVGDQTARKFSEEFDMVMEF